VTEQFALSAALKGAFVGSALFGCMLGAIAAGFISDVYGRQRTLAVAALLMLASAIGCGSAWSASSLIFFRWIGGLGVGVASMVCPLYISEISPPRLRGRLVTLFQFAITIGIFVAFLANAGWQSLSEAGGSGTGLYQKMVVDEVWRAMFAAEAIPALLFFVLCLTIPETPRFLAKVHREDEALSLLERINGAKEANRQMAEIRHVLAQEEGRFSELFRKGFRKGLGVALFLSIVSEMSGVTVVLYYGTEMMGKADIAIASALGGFALVGLVNMLFTVFALWLMDKAGRRPLLFTGTVGCILALAGIGILFYTETTGGTGIILLICLFMACFAFSIGPTKWVVMSEIFPTKIRGRAVAIATVAVWATTGVYSLLYPLVTEEVLFPRVGETVGIAIVFFFFAAVLTPQLFFVLFIMPETKNKSLEEIEAALGGVDRV
jgi:sugar porter (SP) family MFS transporter